ncbi:FMRFamide Peptide Receptor family [Elysia marginata]|uniref:FMRFamide Peptide Receptor family n=1 Tax=Elysia marginata TaxID=1093978 RepID=A0AAV4HHJ9_9GAST|nr:FMRFamide Peptide Receptor family [Elysia marginata]
MLEPIKYVVELGLGTAVILMGITTNVFSVRVFWHQGFDRHHVNVTLLGLALTDLACLFCAFVYRLGYVLEWLLSTRDLVWWYEWVILPFGLTQAALARVTFCLTALLSLERWVSVCHPLRARTWLRKTNLTIATVTTAGVGIAFNVPVILAKTFITAHTSTAQEDKTPLASNCKTITASGLCGMNDTAILKPTTCCNNQQLPVPNTLTQGILMSNSSTAVSDGAFLSLDERDLGSRIIMVLLSQDAVVTYVLICTLVVFPGICNAIVCFCTGAIILRLRKMSRKRLSLSEGSVDGDSTSAAATAWSISSREARLVRSALAVMIIFIACHTLTSVWAHVVLVDRGAMLKKRTALHLKSLVIFMFLETANSSVNFFVYITYFPGFRRTFNQLYPSCSSNTEKD